MPPESPSTAARPDLANERESAAERRLAIGDLDEMVGYHLRRAQLIAFQSFAEMVAEPDITPGRFGVLAMVGANPGLNQTELARALGIDRSTMVAVIDRLETRGLLARKAAPADRRTYALHLTAKGDAFLAELFQRVRRHEQAMTAGLTADERAQLVALLRRIAPNP